MPTIAQITEIENENTDRIYLFVEGLFLKAYQRSAYLFLTQVKPFKAVKKYYKSIAEDVVMLGFPSHNLDAVFPADAVFDRSDSHISIKCMAIDVGAYQKWFDSVELTEPKIKVSPTPKATAVFLPEKSSCDRIVAQVRDFCIESATPLDCMLFLSGLKKELKDLYGTV